MERNGEEREGALPAAAEALEGATPRIAFARPYSVDFTGWLDDFSHSGNFDAMGGFSRIGTHVNAFSIKNGRAVAARAAARAPRTSTRLAKHRAVQPLSRLGRARPRRRLDAVVPPDEDFNCDPTQLPVGQ